MLKENSKRIAGNSLCPFGVQIKNLGAASQTLLAERRLSLRRKFLEPLPF